MKTTLFIGGSIITLMLLAGYYGAQLTGQVLEYASDDYQTVSYPQLR